MTSNVFNPVGVTQRTVSHPLGVRATVGLLLALAFVLVASACSADNGPGDTGLEPPAIVLEQALNEARTGGASPEQVKILEGAVSAGEVTLSDSQAATDAMLACVEAAGFSVSDQTIDSSRGLEIINFYLTSPSAMSEAEADALYWDCETTHRRWVEFAYQNQPQAKSAFFDLVEQHRTEIVACLRKEGSPIEDDATADEMISESLRVSSEATDAGEPNVSDCLYRSGISM